MTRLHKLKKKKKVSDLLHDTDLCTDLFLGKLMGKKPVTNIPQKPVGRGNIIGNTERLGKNRGNRQTEKKTYKRRVQEGNG